MFIQWLFLRHCKEPYVICRLFDAMLDICLPLIQRATTENTGAIWTGGNAVMGGEWC